MMKRLFKEETAVELGDSCSHSGDRRASSQINYLPQSWSPARRVRKHTTSYSTTSFNSSSSSDESDNSESCPFLNKEHLPEFKAMGEQLRNYFRQKNRMVNKPWIFGLQFLKIGLITAMLITLTDSNYGINQAMSDVKEAVSTLLIKDYNQNPDIIKRVYSFNAMDNITSHALGEYFCLSSTAIALLGYPNGVRPRFPGPVQISVTHFDEVEILSDWTVNIDTNKRVTNLTISCQACNYTCVDEHKDQFSAKIFENQLVQYRIMFPLQLLLIGYLSKPHCVHLTYEMIFLNSLETGLETQLWLTYKFDDCSSTFNSVSNDTDFDENLKYYGHLVLDVMVIVVCLISAFVSVKRLIGAFHIYTKTRRFIEKLYNRRLNKREKCLFVNYWHICILIADATIVLASFIKLFIDTAMDLEKYDMCTLLLGVGVWLSYLGLLRYLHFNKHYSMILNTMMVAVPHLLRFMVCITIVSLAYIFCGWLVLSPVNKKFATFWLTMETLFSLLNGDDMFATFDLVKTRSCVYTQRLLLIFSRLYLYSYVSFFIYVALSLCISIIEDAYTVVSNYQSDTCPWIQDPHIFPEFATSWETNLRQRNHTSNNSNVIN